MAIDVCKTRSKFVSGVVHRTFIERNLQSFDDWLKLQRTPLSARLYCYRMKALLLKVFLSLLSVLLMTAMLSTELAIFSELFFFVLSGIGRLLNAGSTKKVSLLLTKSEICYMILRIVSFAFREEYMSKRNGKISDWNHGYVLVNSLSILTSAKELADR